MLEVSAQALGVGLTSIITIAGFIWYAAQASADLRALRRETEKLSARVDEHDDMRERMARLEQSILDLGRSLQRIENSLRIRPE